MQSWSDIARVARVLVPVWAAAVRTAKKTIETTWKLFILPKKSAVVRADSINSRARPKLRLRPDLSNQRRSGLPEGNHSVNSELHPVRPGPAIRLQFWRFVQGMPAPFLARPGRTVPLPRYASANP